MGQSFRRVYRSQNDLDDNKSFKNRKQKELNREKRNWNSERISIVGGQFMGDEEEMGSKTKKYQEK